MSGLPLRSTGPAAGLLRKLREKLPVSGCYADYTALLAANIGPDAYVFALTAGGFVEAVNMTGLFPL